MTQRKNVWAVNVWAVNVWAVNAIKIKARLFLMSDAREQM